MRGGQIVTGLGVAIVGALVGIIAFLWNWRASPPVQGGACDTGRPRACTATGVLTCDGPGTTYTLAEACANCWDDTEGLAECATLATAGAPCFAGTRIACATDRVTLLQCEPKAHRWTRSGTCAPGACNVDATCASSPR
ncbi:MAG TPA: hypothetical protein VGI39_15595 [Polyangiaceae bacterium]|jgi:hypothetical protein